MTTEDKLYNKIKRAAENAPEKDFAGFEKVWNRVDEKLDTVVAKKSNSIWKKSAIAASFLLMISFAYHLYQNNTEQNIKIDTQNTTVATDKAIETSEINETEIIAPEEIDVVIRNQMNNTPIVATEKVTKNVLPDEIQVMNDDEVVIYKKEKTINKIATPKAFSDEDFKIAKDNVTIPLNENSAFNSVSSNTNPILRSDDKYRYDFKEAEVVTSKNTTQKNDDLIIIDDKVASKKELSKMNPKEVDSIVVLPNPLYIINGVEYSEESLFGKNPTSPYAPLGKQKIIKTEVYNPKEALEKFGSKGKNGVVIITTKNGKPISSSK